jgi:hypothetical protein
VYLHRRRRDDIEDLLQTFLVQFDGGAVFGRQCVFSIHSLREHFLGDAVQTDQLINREQKRRMVRRCFHGVRQRLWGEIYSL